MDEYKVELLAIKNDIGNKIRHFQYLKIKLDKFLSLNQKDTNFSKGPIDILKLRKNFELIVSFLVLLEKNESKSGIFKEFFTFLREKFSIYNFDTKDPEFNACMDELFSNLRRVIFLNIYIKNSSENNKFYLSKLDDDLKQYLFFREHLQRYYSCRPVIAGK